MDKIDDVIVINVY